MTVNVLGISYEIEKKKYGEDPLISERDCAGYCNGLLKKIVFCDMTTWPSNDYTETEAGIAQKAILRHEIVHAFLSESGLASNSSESDAWAKNEEMVDWFALQGPKIYKAWQETGCV